MEQKFDTEIIRLITLFENLTDAPVKDCVINNDTIYFIVEEGKVGIAIGKNGSKVKHAENLIKKKIKIIEFSNDPIVFVKKMIPQIADVKIRNENKKAVVELKVEKKYRALVIGRDGRNLKLYEKILRRNHDIDNLIIR